MERHEALEALPEATEGANPRVLAAWNLLRVVLAVASLGPILWPDPRFQVLAA